MRLIDADALMRDIEKYHLSDGKFQHWVEVQPTIEERKRGEWISLDDSRGKYNDYGYKCSECGEHSDYEENFCHNCGADMGGGQDG